MYVDVPVLEAILQNIADSLVTISLVLEKVS